MKNNSVIISQIAVILLPVVVVFGIYIVLGGANSIGGGFQGGAVLSTIYLLVYLIQPEQHMKSRIKELQILEKIFMLALLILVLLVLGREMRMSPMVGNLWMLGLNIIIATKVFCGLSIIFLRFIFYEGR